MELDETTYPIAKKSTRTFSSILDQQRKTLTDLGMPPDQIDLAMQPVLKFMYGIMQDVLAYEDKFLARGK